jgi:putative copper export protein
MARITDMQWVRVVNDLLHDVSAGLGPGAVLALWYVRSGATGTLDPAVLADMTRTWTWVLVILFGALAVLIVTGAVRLSYHMAFVSPEAQQARGRAALVKHAVLVTLFVYAVVVAIGLLQ